MVLCNAVGADFISVRSPAMANNEPDPLAGVKLSALNGALCKIKPKKVPKGQTLIEKLNKVIGEFILFREIDNLSILNPR